MSNKTPFLKRDYAIQGNKTILTSFISFDGVKWIPYGQHLRETHVKLARRAANAQNGSNHQAYAQTA